MGDVQRLHEMTTALDAQDRAFGGGACRDAIVGYLNWATKLRNATMTDDTRRGLDTALTELEILAGWTSFDMRLHDSAEHFCRRAAHSAQLAEEPLLAARALTQIGWIYSKDGHYGDAMRAYQLAIMAVTEVGSPRAVAYVTLSEAEVHARRGNVRATEDAMSRAHFEFARADERGTERHTLMLSDEAQLRNFGVGIYSDLAAHDPSLAPRAIEEASMAAALSESTGRTRGVLQARVALALNHYRCGDTTTANDQAAHVLTALPQVSSRRVLASLRPLAIAAAAHRTDSTATDLAQRISTHAMG